MDDWSAFLSSDARNFRPSAIRSFAKLINDPGIISFAGGLPSPETFPASELLACAETVLTHRKEVALQYGPTPGLPRLRETIAAICRTRKIEATSDDVLVTTGSQQALHLVAEAILDPGDVVLVELPTYIGASSAFFARRAEQVGVAQDDGGIVVDDLRRVLKELRAQGRRIKCLYTIPNFQNPSGRLMQQQRRQELLEIAHDAEFLILEDDPYGALVYNDAADTTPIRAMESSNRVIYLGSFSKVLAPGLRCGWILAPASLLRSFELAKEAADLCSGMLDQSLVDEFCVRGLYEPQVLSVRNFYRERRDVLLEALERHFGGLAHWTAAEGGLFTFLTLHAEVDTGQWVTRAIERGVAYVPGGPFFVDGTGLNTMRLTFAKETDARMREGIARLADLFNQQEP
ncbi:MAG: PLP-dependent aminotransferase family protein [Acidobacteriota bacterium]